MKKIFLIILLLPLLLTAQQRKQCKKCQDPCTGCVAPSKDSSRPMNITVNCQHQNSKDTVLLNQTINNVNDKEDKKEGGMPDWLIPTFATLLLGFLGFHYTNTRIWKENKLKADLEWIKDFRKVSAGIINGATLSLSALPNLREAFKQYDSSVSKLRDAKDELEEKMEERNDIIYHHDNNAVYESLQRIPDGRDVMSADTGIERAENNIKHAEKEKDDALKEFGEERKKYIEKQERFISASNETLLYLDNSNENNSLKKSIFKLTKTSEALDSFSKITERENLIEEIRDGVYDSIASKWAASKGLSYWDRRFKNTPFGKFTVWFKRSRLGQICNLINPFKQYPQPKNNNLG